MPAIFFIGPIEKISSYIALEKKVCKILWRYLVKIKKFYIKGLDFNRSVRMTALSYSGLRLADFRNHWADLRAQNLWLKVKEWVFDSLLRFCYDPWVFRWKQTTTFKRSEYLQSITLTAKNQSLLMEQAYNTTQKYSDKAFKSSWPF